MLAARGVAHADALVFIVDLLQFRLQQLHLARRFERSEFQRKHRQIDEHGQQNNRPAVIVYEAVVNEVENKKQGLRDNAEPAPLDNAVEFGVHLMERRELLRPEINSELVSGCAAHRDSGIRFLGAIQRRRNDVVVGRGLKRSIGRRQERRGEILVVDAGEREYAVRVDRAVFRGFGGRPIELVLLKIVMNGRLLTGGVLHGHVAEAASPPDQMRKTGTIQSDVIRILDHVAILLQSERLGGVSSAIGVFKTDCEFGSGMNGPQRFVQIGRRLFVPEGELKGVADLFRAFWIHQLQGLASAVFEFLQSPALNRGASIGENDMIEAGFRALDPARLRRIQHPRRVQPRLPQREGASMASSEPRSP